MDLPHEVEISRWIAALGRISAPHPELDRVLSAIERLQERPCRLNCLIDGEPGTGKDGLARVLHRLMHPAPEAPLVRLWTSGRPAAEVEQELASETGPLYWARGGSLIIEELLHLSPLAQRLLHGALSSRGGRSAQPGPAAAPSGAAAAVTIIALTDGDAAGAVRSGQLRHDLYYRLARLWLTLPPLRDRPEDLQQAALWMVNRVLRAHGWLGPGGQGRSAVLAESAPGAAAADYRVQPAALTALKEHGWSGNFRELEAVLERAVVLHSDGQHLTAADVRAALRLPAL